MNLIKDIRCLLDEIEVITTIFTERLSIQSAQLQGGLPRLVSSIQYQTGQ